MANILTTTLVDGVWTTRSLDVQAVLLHHEQKMQEQKPSDEVVRVPVFGVLTRTVVPSPMVNWILPARIRRMERNDVAFIGTSSFDELAILVKAPSADLQEEHYIQTCPQARLEQKKRGFAMEIELMGTQDNFVLLREFSDGRLHDIVSKSDFGSRIRSAIVIGNIPPISATSPSSEHSDDDDTYMGDAPAVASHSRREIPPQYLVLALESGDLVFLYIKELPNSTVRWVTTRSKVPEEMAATQAGTHFTVDPSARYMALSCFENLFAIYELRSPSELDQQYADGDSFNPLKGEHHFSASGIIHKMEFLYPDSKDKDRIILLLMVIKGGMTKLFVYVWDAFDDLSTIRPLNRNGHLVSEAAQLPILLIPLRIDSNFLLVSEEKAVLFKGILEDAPHGEQSDVPPLNGITDHHHGVRPPKFTAWARPRRLKEWGYENDFIYLAREDGAIAGIEYSAEDKLRGISSAGNVECNIGKAFACVDADHGSRKDDYRSIQKKTADILVIGGDMSNGAIYSVFARVDPERIMSISNWTPTPDFVIVPDYRSRRKKVNRREPNGNEQPATNDFTWPDRIFMCTGRGKDGAVSELRYGLEAQIGTKTPLEEDMLIREMWAFSGAHSVGMLLCLLSLNGQSALLQFESDEDIVGMIDKTWLDLSAETILAQTVDDYVIQVTGAGFILSSFPLLQCEGQKREDFREQSFPSRPEIKHLKAVLHEKLLCTTTRNDDDGEFYLTVLQLDLDDEPRATELFAPISLGEEPTCLFMEKIAGEPLAFFALASEPGHIYVLQMSGKVHKVSLCSVQNEEVKEGILHSIAIVRDRSRPIVLCGFRDGSFRTYIIVTPDAAATDEVFVCLGDSPDFAEKPLAFLPRDSTQIGTTDVTITLDHLLPGAAFVRCDPDIWRFTFDETGEDELSMSSLHQILLVDKDDPSAELPPANFVTRINYPGTEFNDQLLISSGPNIIMADLDPTPKAVLRTMVIGATPTGLYYAEYIDSLVVAVNLPVDSILNGPAQPRKGHSYGKTNIFLISPHSGKNIGNPVENIQNRKPQDFIKGLGKHEKIISLGEWTHEKDGMTFVYIVVTTNSGSLLAISAAIKEPTIDYWTKNTFHFHDPVYSFARTNSDLFICHGNEITWLMLDASKKMKDVAGYSLPSPGVSVHVAGDLLSIVTSRHSMIVLKIVADEKLFRPHLTDQVARRGLAQQAVPCQPLHLMSDRTNSVVGLWYPDTCTFTDAARTIFEAELASSIVQFQTGSSGQRRTNKLCAGDVEWFEARSSAAANAGELSSPPKILGISINGSLHSFEVLSPSVWALLRYIQNVAMHSPLVCPLTHDRVERDQFGNYQIDPWNNSKASNKHVNGDILARCKSLGRSGFVALMKQSLPEDDEYENAETRCERFAALVAECLGEGQAEGMEGASQERGEEGEGDERGEEAREAELEEVIRVDDSKPRRWDPFWEAFKIMGARLGGVGL